MSAMRDSVDRRATGEFGEDEKGKFEYYKYYREVPCNCHPETCSHFGGTITQCDKRKVYV